MHLVGLYTYCKTMHGAYNITSLASQDISLTAFTETCRCYVYLQNQINQVYIIQSYLFETYFNTFLPSSLMSSKRSLHIFTKSQIGPALCYESFRLYANYTPSVAPPPHTYIQIYLRYVYACTLSVTHCFGSKSDISVAST